MDVVAQELGEPDSRNPLEAVITRAITKKPP